MKPINKALFELIGILLLVIIAIVVLRFNDIKGGFFTDSISFIPTQGKIVTSEFHYHVGVKGVSGYRYTIEYEFEIKGKKYEADKINFGSKSFRRKQKAQEITDKYPVGREITVYYEKDNPNLSVLEPKVNANNDFIIGLVVFFLFISFLLAIPFFYQKKKKGINKVSLRDHSGNLAVNQIHRQF